MRKLQLIALLLIVFNFLFFFPQAFSQTTTQKTENRQIGPSPFVFTLEPRPDSPNVCVQYTLTLDAATGEATLKAKFTNKDGGEKKFVFCQMIGIPKDPPGKAPVEVKCDLTYDTTAKKIKCQASTWKLESEYDSYHFGCKEVTVRGNADTTIDYGKGQHDKFKGKKASDFYVAYADYIKLPAGASFDGSSCDSCYGANRGTCLDRGSTPEIWGDWYIPELPFKDPFIVYQPVDTSIGMGVPEYRSFSLPLGVPSDFQVPVSQLPHNIPQTPPNFYAVPLNLFDIYTMEADSSESTMVSLTLDVKGVDSSVVRFFTNPPPGQIFYIPGGEEPVGIIGINVVGSPQEGDTAAVTVVVHEPDTVGSLNRALFTEKGFFIHDTEPPQVLFHSVGSVSSNRLYVHVSARDSTTGPLGADFWFTTDAGTSWFSQGLTSTSDLFVRNPWRTFNGEINLPTNLAYSTILPPIQYFFIVQDEVFNMVYYGVDSTVHPCFYFAGDANKSGSLTLPDIIILIGHIFKGAPKPDPPCVGDCNNTNTISLSDVIILVNHIFKGGPKPARDVDGPCCK